MAHNDMQMIAASSIEEELGCPVCHTVPRTLPIPCCPRGHLVCQSCRGKIRDGNCPTCRLPMGNNVSTVAGALVDKIPHACRFSDLGCEEKDILQHIVEHEKNCPVKERSHPVPLPAMPKFQPSSPGWKTPPPRPALKIFRVANGIVLSWNMNINLSSNATITSYQLYAYQESNQQRPDPNLWKKVGDVKALPLPMACTLTEFTRGNKYHFAVRAMDLHQRVGNFSEPSSIFLN